MLNDKELTYCFCSPYGSKKENLGTKEIDGGAETIWKCKKCGNISSSGYQIFKIYPRNEENNREFINGVIIIPF